MNNDLTVGAPQKVIWRFCLPLFGSVVFQQLYNIADSLVAGKYIGDQALAAVGNSYEITLIFLAFAFGCNMGCSVITSKFFGAKKLGDMKTAISTSMIATAITCVLLMLMGLCLGDDMLRLIRTPEAIFADSSVYLRIYTLGLPFLFFYNVANGIFTALGDSKTPFYFLAFSSLSNIGVDILFVKAFSMGVEGVALATLLCQGISCIMAVLVVLLRLKKIKTSENKKLFAGEYLKMFLQIAIPSTLQQSFISIGNIIIQGVINGFGYGVVAGYSAAVKVNNLVITSFTTIGNGISNYTAQNLGAKKEERVKEGMLAGIRMVACFSVSFAILYFFFGRYILLLFMKDQAGEAMRTGEMFLRIISPFYVVISIKLIADGILRGAGKMGYFMIATFADLILRVVLSIILSATALQSTGIWCAWPIGWSIGTLISIVFYKMGVWKLSQEGNGGIR